MRTRSFAALLTIVSARIIVGCSGSDDANSPEPSPPPSELPDTASDASVYDAGAEPDVVDTDVGGTAAAMDGSVADAPPVGADADTCLAAKKARAALVPGTYKPDASNTGPLPCVPLTRHDGDYKVDAPNTIIEGLDIYGSLVLGKTATNVVVRNCIVRGPGKSSLLTSAVSGGGTATVYDRLGLLIEDSRIDLTGRETWFLNNIEGANFTLRRSEILRGVDGVGLVSQGGNVTVEGCFIHKGFWTSWTAETPPPKPAHSDMQTHTDAIQFHRGRNYTIRGNAIGGARLSGSGTGDDFNNACLMISQGVDSSSVNKLENVLIEKNWFQGGAATINLAYSNGNNLSGVTIRDNRFLRGPGYYILRGSGTAPKLSNNVFDDTGLAVPVVDRP